MTRPGGVDGGVQPSKPARLLGWSGVGLTASALLPRLTPIGNGDIFTFVSVAERLRAGDRHYADVWDNKDPFFYYGLAVASEIGPWGYLVLELGWVLLALTSIAALGRSQGMPREWSLVVAFVLAPWCLIGYVYTGGLPMMPGVAVVFAVLALADRDRWVAVGAALGVLVFLKVILIPIAVAGAVVLWRPRHARALVAAAVGSLVAVGSGLGVLAFREELAAYFSVLRRNSDYAGRMVEDDGFAGFMQRMARAFPAIDYPGERIAGAAIVLVIAAAFVGGRHAPSSRQLAACAGVSALTCAAVLGLTAVWSHHVQILAVPGCLALLALARPGPPRHPGQSVVLLGGGVLVSYAMGGATPLSTLLIKPTTAAQPIEQVRGVSPEALSIRGDDVATYSRSIRKPSFPARSCHSCPAGCCWKSRHASSRAHSPRACDYGRKCLRMGQGES